VKYLRVSLGAVLLLTILACAKPPTARVTAARDAVAALDADADVGAFAGEARTAAHAAFEAMDAELQAQAGKGPLSRSYKQLAALADEALRLAAKAKDEARARRSELDAATAETARITQAIDAIDSTGVDAFGQSDVAVVRGGSLEYLASDEQSGSIALYDAGYPDTGMGEGFVPDRKVLLCQFLVAYEVQDTIEGSREELLPRLVDEGYQTEQGALDFPNPVRFASRVRQGTDSDIESIAIYALDDQTGVGVQVCSLGVPPGSAGPVGSVTSELPYSVTPTGKAAVLITRRAPMNEFDAGEDIVVVVTWEAQSRFAEAISTAAYREAASRAGAGDVEGAVQQLSFLAGVRYPVAEELLARVRGEERFDGIRSSEAYVHLMKNAFPTSSRHGLVEVFEEYACDLAQPRLGAGLDEEDLARYGDISERIVDASKGQANYAGTCVIATWPCGSGCESGVLIDLEDGRILDLPQSTGGYEHQSTSLLLVVNPPQFLEGNKFTPRDAYPVYYTWTGKALELLADLRAAPSHGK
jgi:hypothetical protein